MKFLIAGGEGRLGKALAKELGSGAVAIGKADLDVTKRRNIEEVVGEVNPDVIINCAAILSVQAEREKKLAWDVNVTGAANLSKSAFFRCIRLVHISTDYVFDGQKGSYREDDVPNPVNYYGYTKSVGEAVVAHDNVSLVLRAPFRYDGPWQYETAFVDQWISGRWMVEVVPDIVAACCDTSLFGILHIGGDRNTVFSLARQRHPAVFPGQRSDFKEFSIPYDVTLDSSRWGSVKADAYEKRECERDVLVHTGVGNVLVPRSRLKDFMPPGDPE